MNKLKLCPFCSGQVEMRDVIDGHEETFAFHCTSCHIHFTKFDWVARDRKDVIEEWNKREKGMIKEIRDCLNCSASFSDDDENGKMILRCAEHDWKIVDENDCCENWN